MGKVIKVSWYSVGFDGGDYDDQMITIRYLRGAISVTPTRYIACVFDTVLLQQIEYNIDMLRVGLNTVNRLVRPGRASSIKQLARSCSSTTNQTTEAPAAVPYEWEKVKDSKGPVSLPSHADVVIIGGGAMGCNMLYHLTKLGMTNVILLERDELTSGTSWHSAGLVWNLRTSDVEVDMLVYARNLMESLEAETGIDPGWINNGGLFVANNKVRMDDYRRLHSLGKAYGVESHLLSPEETKKLYPHMFIDDMFPDGGSLYSPRDGTIDPAGYCMALTRGATSRGGKVFTKCIVKGVETTVNDFGTKMITGVRTTLGDVTTNAIVNCTGVWAPMLGKMAGVTVPQVAMRHAYVVTEKIEGIQNMPNSRDHDASVYLKLQGDALSVGGYEPNPIFWDDVKEDFAFSLFELDWDVFGHNIMGAMHRVPIIEQTGIKSTVCGPESFTADHRPLLGEATEVRGFYHASGFNSGGLMFSGGCARELSRWIADGRPNLDMYNYDIRRFTTRLTGNDRWVRERSHESYNKNYSILFPHDQPLAARNTRTDALYQTMVDAGCVFEERQGWERPGYFNKDGPAPPLEYDYYGYYDNQKHEDNKYFDKLKEEYNFDFPPCHEQIEHECLTCRESVAVFNMSYFGKYYLTGPDAQKAADWIFSNNMQKKAGSTVYTCMLHKYGGIQADLTVSVLEPGSGGPHDPAFEGSGFYVAVGGGVAQYTYSHILDILQDNQFNCQLTDLSDDMGMISIQGPNSRAVMSALSDTDFSNEAFPFSTHKVIKIGGHSVRAMRLSFVGELGWELHMPNDACVEIYKAVMAAGEKYGIVNGGYRALDSLSLEKGYKLWTTDIRTDDLPLEAGLAFTCKLKSETPFLGREQLIEQKQKGMKKRLVTFTIDEHVPLHSLESVWRDGEVVGFLRRADYAFSLGKSFGVGYISNPSGEPITTDFIKSGNYEIDHMGEMYKAKMYLKSPFDPSNKRVKGVYDEALPIRQ
ncbi:unnamed protein product [Owenia fusiformis]|uniref:Uncharacterized protein n=1 Tax=Owenia fusiformis TaxID=6347 RepID=A0A8J1TZE1_OWEFU|nr:unnamed protein product [Owenia fusiformis]